MNAAVILYRLDDLIRRAATRTRTAARCTITGHDWQPHPPCGNWKHHDERSYDKCARRGCGAVR